VFSLFRLSGSTRVRSLCPSLFVFSDVPLMLFCSWCLPPFLRVSLRFPPPPCRRVFRISPVLLPTSRCHAVGQGLLADLVSLMPFLSREFFSHLQVPAQKHTTGPFPDKYPPLFRDAFADLPPFFAEGHNGDSSFSPFSS